MTLYMRCTGKEKNLFVFILKKHRTDHLEEITSSSAPGGFPVPESVIKTWPFLVLISLCLNPCRLLPQTGPGGLLQQPLCLRLCVYWSMNACNTFNYTPSLLRIPLFFPFASVRPLKCYISSDPSLLNSRASQSHRRLNGSLCRRCCCFYSVCSSTRIVSSQRDGEMKTVDSMWAQGGICVVFIVTTVYQIQQRVLKSGRICHAVMEGTKDASLKITRCKNDPNCMIHTLHSVCVRERELQLL